MNGLMHRTYSLRFNESINDGRSNLGPLDCDTGLHLKPFHNRLIRTKPLKPHFRGVRGTLLRLRNAPSDHRGAR